ncbi:MAG: N-acetylglucosamine-6-phosphate deacetylase [Ruminococcaceae bacterium]|nr:N-acetylglucosamine-6-phosphate deacetylase [Oscillospiraceae bacterium]
MTLKIINGRIITDTVEKDKALYIRDGKILAVTADEIAADEVIDAAGAYVSPGFVDLHTHGAGGTDFMDGTPEDVRTALQAHVQYGTTAIMPTCTTANPASFRKSIEDIGAVMRENNPELPQVLGAHLEGPYFSQEQAGAQAPEFITDPIKEEYEELLSEYKGIIARWSFAPERKGAPEFCETLIKHGVVPSIAHTNATYDEIMPVYNAGCRLMTHFYSGMSLLTRRQGFRVLGAVETGYLLDDMYVETIADGKHLPPELLRLIYKVTSSDYICMVTDSMRGAGVEGIKEMILGPIADGRIAIIEDGVAKMPDRINFAGSIATTDRLVRVMHKEAGVDIVNAVKMMTKIPAKIAGANHIGAIEAGRDADIVLFNDNIEIQKVLLKGKERKI